MSNTIEVRKQLLVEKRDELIQKNKKNIVEKRFAIGSSIFVIFLGYVFYWLVNFFNIVGPEEDKVAYIISWITALVGLIILCLTIFNPQISYKADLQEVENELELLGIALSSEEERAEKLFKHHHLELKRYYDENLKQSSWIFIVGILCIIAGFVIIGLTLYLLYSNLSSQTENKIIIASVGAVGAILTNFIAVVFLKMHSETIKSLTEFHNRFVNTHHFYFGNFLVSKVKNQEKREEALVNLALNTNATVTENQQSTVTNNELI